MPVRKDASGRRSVELEIELQGTPEQVWEAVATGAGIASWFVPATVEEREGGSMLMDFGPGLQSPATVTRWDPPRLFAYEEREWLPGAPPVATEITVEARAGGTCVVRMVHSLFAAEDRWDDQLAGFESGWPPFFEILRLRLSRFAGRPHASIRVSRSIEAPEVAVWRALAHPLGMADAGPGEAVRAAAGVPCFEGIVRRIGARRHHDMLVELRQPAPGVAFLQAYRWADRGSLSIALYLFGAEAAGVAAREQPIWDAWVDRVLHEVPATTVVRG